MLCEKSKIVLIGTGNVGTQLAKNLVKRGLDVLQVSGRSFVELPADAGLYILAVKDDAIPDVVARMPDTKGIVAHTAGSVDMAVLAGKFARYGVFYPLQTFSKSRDVDFSEIPVFLEANDEKTLSELKNVASILTKNINEANSEKRKYLHLSAVFACNFVNHLYALAGDIVQKAGYDIDVLLPLINETSAKIRELPPREAQTGPAVRNDKTVMNRHLELLKGDEKLQEIYSLLSESIFESKIYM